MSFSVGDVVVHKSLGSQPLVVSRLDVVEGENVVFIRYASQGKYGLSFVTELVRPEELETPEESIEREAEIFKALNAKRDEINSATASKPGPVGIKHLN